MLDKKPLPRYLTGEGIPILEHTTVRVIGADVWMDVEVRGMLLRFVLSPREVADLLAVLTTGRSQLTESEGGSQDVRHRE